MPPKTKNTQENQSSELVPQVFMLENLNPALLPELANFKEKQLKVVEDNPFIAITDTASRELAKKYRTNRVSARTALQSQDKLISSKFNEAKTKAKTYIAELIAYTQPGEIEQQKEIDRDEAVLEAKRKEKARLEQERIDTIKKTISDYATEWETAFNLMSFETIDNVSSSFLASYTDYDTEPLEEFEVLFTKKVEELTQTLMGKTSLLKGQEETRLEKEAMRLAAEKLAQEQAAFKAQQEVIAAEQKSIFEQQEKTRLANEASLKVIAYAQAKLDADKKAQQEAEAKKLATLEAQRINDLEAERNAVPMTPKEAIATVIEYTDPASIETLVGIENATNKDQHTTISYNLPKETTWNDVFEDFKASGEKSLSKWLESNYNVPSKK